MINNIYNTNTFCLIQRNRARPYITTVHPIKFVLSKEVTLNVLVKKNVDSTLTKIKIVYAKTQKRHPVMVNVSKTT